MSHTARLQYAGAFIEGGSEKEMSMDSPSSDGVSSGMETPNLNSEFSSVLGFWSTLQKPVNGSAVGEFPTTQNVPSLNGDRHTYYPISRLAYEIPTKTNTNDFKAVDFPPNPNCGRQDKHVKRTHFYCPPHSTPSEESSDIDNLSNDYEIVIPPKPPKPPVSLRFNENAAPALTASYKPNSMRSDLSNLRSINYANHMNPGSNNLYCFFIPREEPPILPPKSPIPRSNASYDKCPPSTRDRPTSGFVTMPRLSSNSMQAPLKPPKTIQNERKSPISNNSTNINHVGFVKGLPAANSTNVARTHNYYPARTRHDGNQTAYSRRNRLNGGAGCIQQERPKSVPLRYYNSNHDDPQQVTESSPTRGVSTVRYPTTAVRHPSTEIKMGTNCCVPTDRDQTISPQRGSMPSLDDVDNGKSTIIRVQNTTSNPSSYSDWSSIRASVSAGLSKKVDM